MASAIRRNRRHVTYANFWGGGVADAAGFSPLLQVLAE